MNRIISAALLVGLLMACLRSAWPIGLSPCSEPVVFPGAAVNAVILPYRYTGKDRFSPLSETAEALSGLIHLETLFSMLKYGSVGATRLVGDPEGCDLEDILYQIAVADGGQTIRPKHGLVILWGKLYEEGDAIFVQSYLRFFRRGESEILSMTLTDNKPDNFTARLPELTVRFAPRILYDYDIRDIQATFKDAILVRDEPSTSSSGRPFQPDMRLPAAYWVTEVEEDWIRVESQFDSSTGWVQARNLDQWPLRQKMPELEFLDGVVGFLRYRVGQAFSLTAARETANRIGELLSSFESMEQEDGRGTSESLAISQAVRGFVRFDQAQESEKPGIEAVAAAAERFSEAVRILPFNADLRNLDFLARLQLEMTADPDQSAMESLIQQLLDALAVGPDNRDVLSNLQHLYGFLREHEELAPFPIQRLDERIAAVAKIRSRLSNGPAR